MVLVSVLVIVLLPLPEAPPVRPAPSVGVLHVYVVPVGIVPVGVYEKPTALQEVVACEAIVVTGFTTTLTVKVLPKHVPDVGVRLYTAVTGLADVLVSTSLSVLCADCAPLLPEKPMPAGVLHA